MFSPKSIRLASYIVMVYIIVAIGWWAVLLYSAHDALYDTYEVVREHQIQTDLPHLEEIRALDYDSLLELRKRKSIMVLSESIFIGLGLLIGLWVINNGYKNLVRAEKVKQNFLLSISHELKSPIASAKLAFESLLRLKNPDDQSKEIIKQGLKETNRLHELVKNVLLATRLETAYLPDFQAFDLKQNAEQLILSLQIQYPGANIKLDVHPLPMQEMMDKQAFEIVLKNLMENAIKYSPDEEEIRVRISRRNFEIELTVADQGIGIQEEEKSKVFKRFYRVGEEGTRKSKGTGLGLYLVKELVTRNGGKITLKDNQPRGTIIHITWPIDHEIQSP